MLQVDVHLVQWKSFTVDGGEWRIAQAEYVGLVCLIHPALLLPSTSAALKKLSVTPERRQCWL